jgi:hypothetical protein
MDLYIKMECLFDTYKSQDVKRIGYANWTMHMVSV